MSFQQFVAGLVFDNENWVWGYLGPDDQFLYVVEFASTHIGDDPSIQGTVQCVSGDDSSIDPLSAAKAYLALRKAGLI
jgi:hypothetical protein